MRGGSGRTGPLQNARDNLKGRHESALQVWIGPRRQSGHWASEWPLAKGWLACSTVQAKGPLRPAPQASALPALPTGTGQSVRRLRQRGCLRAKQVSGRRRNMCKIFQTCKISNKIPNMQQIYQICKNIPYKDYCIYMRYKA